MSLAVINDTFTGAAADVTSRAMDTGDFWSYDSSYTGGLTLDGSGNMKRSSAGVNAGMVYSQTQLDAAQTAHSQVQGGNPSNGNNSWTYLGARWNSSSRSGYLLEWYQGAFFAADATITLYRVVNGTWTQVGLYTMAAAASNSSPLSGELYLDVAGTGATVTVTVKWAGTTRITYSDTNAARIVSPGSIIAGVYYDTGGNYVVTSRVWGDGTIYTPPVASMPPRPTVASYATARASRW